FTIGGLRHGTQRFTAEQARMIAMLTVLAVSALAVPTLVDVLHAPASEHAEQLSVAVAVVLVVIYVLSIPVALAAQSPIAPGPDANEIDVAPARSAHRPWPLWLAAGMLGLAAVGAAFVSDWFVEALRPAMET